jgi:hypothetical protein
VSPLERRYRRWLRAYPADYRAQRGDEIIGLLLDTSRVGQQRADVRDIADIARHGFGMRLAAGPRIMRPETVATAAPVASAVAAGLALVALVFGELPLYGADPGFQPNQFMYGAFASRGIYLYPLVILAGLARLAGAGRVSRAFSVASLVVVAGIVPWVSPESLGGTHPPFPLLLTIASCCVPAALVGASAPSPLQRRGGIATITAIALAGAVSFSGQPHGHPHWDPRSTFYLMPDGIIGSWRVFAPLAAAGLLTAGAWFAARSTSGVPWYAAQWALLPAAFATYGPGLALAAPWVSWTYHVPLIVVVMLAAAAVAANTVLHLRRPAALRPAKS